MKIFKSIFKIPRREWIEKYRIEKRKNMRIPAKTNGKPLEHYAEGRHMVIFAETKYEPDTKVLETLELVKLFLGEVQITSIGVIQYRE